jgi:glyoxylase-like metal-dependent hydrolase (beta-lactamase superfamily II)
MTGPFFAMLSAVRRLIGVPNASVRGDSQRYAYLMLGFMLATSSVNAPQAAAPMVKAQSPGYYRMKLGAFEITILNDGVVALPPRFVNVSAEEVRHRLTETYLTDPYEMSFNAFLVNTADKLVLIDTGMGELEEIYGWHGAGQLLANLRAAGYQPEQVDEICITHTHLDHVGGLILANQRAFPNAIVHAARAELAPYFESTQQVAELASGTDQRRAPADILTVRRLFEPYMKVGKFQSFEQDITIVPGVRAFATHGHTPGHTSYIVESNGETLVVLGDLIHIGAVQFDNPLAQANSDVDPREATSQRNRVFQLAAQEGYWIGGSHLAFPGIGHIRQLPGKYLWIPANYQIPN